MTPKRLAECLSSIHWTPETLASVLECDVSFTNAWLDGRAEAPVKISAWLQVLAMAHKAADTGKPASLKGKRFTPDNPSDDA